MIRLRNDTPYVSSLRWPLHERGCNDGRPRRPFIARPGSHVLRGPFRRPPKRRGCALAGSLGGAVATAFVIAGLLIARCAL